MKKSLSIAAFTLAACCAFGAAGCGGSSRNIVSLESNWYSGINYSGFQPTFTEGNSTYSAEDLTYTVTFDGSGAANPSYTVSYAEGTYKTYFTSKILNKDEIEKITFDGNRGEYNSQSMQVYYYRTELTIPSVTFTLKSDNTKTATVNGESIITESYFLSVADYLCPVYSAQRVKSATPRNYQVGNIESAYVIIDRTYENFYSYKRVVNSGNKVVPEPSEAVTVTTVNSADYGYNEFTGTQNGESKTSVSSAVNLFDAPNTVFDIASLNTVVRACNLSAGENLSQAISLYVPWSKQGVNNFGVAGSSAPLVLDKNAEQNTAKLNELTSKLKDANLYEEQKDSEGNVIPLKTVAVSVGTTAGVSQTYWFAAINSTHSNVGHATMLKMSVPVTFGLGVFNYTLSEITHTFIS